MRSRNPKKLISGALLALVVGSLWFYLAPTGVGGSTSWVVTDGISMEPRFHAGDLVLVRAQSDYKVGEIVAYHSKAFHTVVLHRIVGRAGSRYIFKGDNNNFVDFEHPARSQLIGALWLHLPGWGSRLESVHSPVLIGGLFALATLLFAGAAFTSRRRRRGRQRRADGPGAPKAGSAPRMPREPQAAVLAGGFLAMLPFAILAVIAFTRPADALLRTQVPYEQRATLAYTAPSRPGPVYPGNLARTGDPLFTHVINRVRLAFGYRFEAREAHRLSGTIKLLATIQSSAGWRRTIPLGRPVSFRGDSATADTTVELQSLLALVRTVESSTGVRSTYTLTLTPTVLANGAVGGLPLHAAFAPTLGFSLNPLELQPLVPGAAASSAGRVPASAFTRSAGGTATGRRAEPMQLSLGALSLPVATARDLSLLAIAVVACAIAALATLARPRRRDESAAILARYGGLIIPVEQVWQLPGVAVIDVADIDALVRIADHYDRSILHELTDYGEAFWVTDESGQFRYWIGPADSSLPEVAPEQTEAGPAIWAEPALEPAPDDAPTLEFTAVRATAAGQARDAPAWSATTESVEYIEGSAGADQGLQAY
jgi:signal peptidase I